MLEDEEMPPIPEWNPVEEIPSVLKEDVPKKQQNPSFPFFNGDDDYCKKIGDEESCDFDNKCAFCRRGDDLVGCFSMESA